MGDRVAIQGNMDPSVLYAPEADLQAYVAQIVNDYGQGRTKDDPEFNLGHIFNLGHGIHQDVDPSAPTIMLDALEEFTRRQ